MQVARWSDNDRFLAANCVHLLGRSRSEVGLPEAGLDELVTSAHRTKSRHSRNPPLSSRGRAGACYARRLATFFGFAGAFFGARRDGAGFAVFSAGLCGKMAVGSTWPTLNLNS